MNKRTTKHAAVCEAAMDRCMTMAVDLAKTVFQAAGEDALGQVVFETRLRSREAFRTFLRQLPEGVELLMEPGPGAQAWAREAITLGKRVRLLPAQRVAEHRSGAKNDRNDAHALLRAGRDRSIEAVPIKSAEALAMQAQHRVRAGYMKRRTAIGNQIRGLLLEQGIAMPKGGPALLERAGRVIEDATQPVPDALRELVADLLAEWNHLGMRIDVLTARLTEVARHHDETRRLMTVRGFGPIIATALIAKQPRPERFASGRQFAAYFGTVPDQHSSGTPTRLGRMSKRGDGYLRSLAIQGAHSVLQQVRADSTAADDQRLLRWLQRHGRKGAAVRLANRNLRIAWSLLKGDGVYRRERPSQPEETMTD
jgi:transposase